MNKNTILLPDDPDRPTIEESRTAHRRYAEEGHLVSIAVLDIRPESVLDIPDDAPVFAATCTCGEGSLMDQTPTLDRPDVGVTHEAARNWARAHRTRHGLPWQPTGWPFVPRARTASLLYRDEGHCVTYAQLPDDHDGEYWMMCTCADMERLHESAFIAASWELGLEWANLHRERQGLQPQVILPQHGHLLRQEQTIAELDW